MIVRLVFASLRRRFRQLGLILAAVTVAAATVATLAAFSARAERRLGASLAVFGPNLTVRPQVGGAGSIPRSAIERVRALPGVESAAGVPAEGAGERQLARIAVRVAPARLEEVARAIETQVEGVEAAPLLRVSAADERLRRRLMLVLGAVSAVSLLLALLAVSAATAALVGERRIEVGMMLALGFTGRRVGAIFAAELLVAALLAGLLGALLGELAAAGLEGRMLGPGSGPEVTGSSLAAAALVAVLVVGASLVVTLRRVERLDAASVLRGE
ncbi:MAG TPA: FtsX-like permease family protein [Thermoanaerobaculia bacterium]|nr:FtsX-like permease family protein [Thermoanaerobaculia bacterium]